MKVAGKNLHFLAIIYSWAIMYKLATCSHIKGSNKFCQFLEEKKKINYEQLVNYQYFIINFFVCIEIDRQSCFVFFNYFFNSFNNVGIKNKF